MYSIFIIIFIIRPFYFVLIFIFSIEFEQIIVLLPTIISKTVHVMRQNEKRHFSPS